MNDGLPYLNKKTLRKISKNTLDKVGVHHYNRKSAVEKRHF